MSDVSCFAKQGLRCQYPVKHLEAEILVPRALGIERGLALKLTFATAILISPLKATTPNLHRRRMNMLLRLRQVRWRAACGRSQAHDADMVWRGGLIGFRILASEEPKWVHLTVLLVGALVKIARNLTTWTLRRIAPF